MLTASIGRVGFNRGNVFRLERDFRSPLPHRRQGRTAYIQMSPSQASSRGLLSVQPHSLAAAWANHILTVLTHFDYPRTHRRRGTGRKIWPISGENRVVMCPRTLGAGG